MSDTKTRDTGVSLTYINNNYIRSDGGTPVFGSIDMRGNTLYNVPDPVNPQDVATKEYTDKIKNLIVVHASYHGPLRAKEFQFSFGGNEVNRSTTGFLIRHSGRIKKIKMRTPINKDSFNKALVEGRFDFDDYYHFGIFTFTRKRPDGGFEVMGKISCKREFLDLPDDHYLKKEEDMIDYCFDGDAPIFFYWKPKVEEGDIINIRSMINLDFPPDISKPDDHMRNTYLVTFLIELDPLSIMF